MKVHWGMGRSNVLIVSCVLLILGFSLVPPEGFKGHLWEPRKIHGALKLAHASSQKLGLSDKYLFELPEKCQEDDNPQIYPNLSLTHICFPEYTKTDFTEAEPARMQDNEVFWGLCEALMKTE